MLRATKGRVADIARDECGHIALLAALDCVDDTLLLSKTILAELLPQLQARPNPLRSMLPSRKHFPGRSLQGRPPQGLRVTHCSAAIAYLPIRPFLLP